MGMRYSGEMVAAEGSPRRPQTEAAKFG
jgi:hypothetical protein